MKWNLTSWICLPLSFLMELPFYSNSWHWINTRNLLNLGCLIDQTDRTFESSERVTYNQELWKTSAHCGQGKIFSPDFPVIRFFPYFHFFAPNYRGFKQHSKEKFDKSKSCSMRRNFIEKCHYYDPQFWWSLCWVLKVIFFNKTTN